MKYYYQKKAEKEELLGARKEKAVQVELAFHASGSPYPTKQCYFRAVRRLKEKFKSKGKKFAFLVKGVLKTTDRRTKKTLVELFVCFIA